MTPKKFTVKKGTISEMIQSLSDHFRFSQDVRKNIRIIAAEAYTKGYNSAIEIEKGRAE
jgi:hypothetical protein